MAPEKSHPELIPENHDADVRCCKPQIQGITRGELLQSVRQSHIVQTLVETITNRELLQARHNYGRAAAHTHTHTHTHTLNKRPRNLNA